MLDRGSREPFYREAARVSGKGASLVNIGYHPQFLVAGVPTHFDRAPGEPVSIHSYVHLFGDHVRQSRAAGGP